MIKVADIPRILWQYRMMIILTVITSLIIVTLGLVLLPPTYSASALIRISLPPSTLGARVDIDYADRIMNTYTIVMTSRPVLNKIIDELEMDITRDDLKQSIHAQAIEDTELMQISATALEPALAANIVNVTINALIADLAAAPRPTSSTILAQIGEIQQELDELRVEYNQLLVTAPDQIQRISELSRSTTVKQQTYEALLDQYDQARLSESLTFSAITMVDPAVAPEKPIIASKPLIVGLGSIVGLVGGIGLSLFLHNMNRTLISSNQLQPLLTFPVIGTIPNIARAGKLNYQDEYRLEAFRHIRTDLLTIDNTSKIFAITSANPGEGKSTIVANLAISLTQLKRKVLVIDCDLRSPTQGKLFNLPNEVGVTSILINPKSMHASIQDSSSPLLKVLTSGPLIAHSTELLSITTERFAKLLSILEREYDYILLDTPPLLPVADSAIIIPLADIVIQVVRMGYSAESSTISAQQKITQLHAGPARMILNDVPHSEILYQYSVIPANHN